MMSVRVDARTELTAEPAGAPVQHQYLADSRNCRGTA